MGSAVDRDVALFRDWCAATGVPWPPGPDVFPAFTIQVPCRDGSAANRLRHISAHLGWRTEPAPRPNPYTRPGRLTSPVALTRLARIGAGYGIGADWWVLRVRALRDAWVVALLAAGLTRNQVAVVAPEHVTRDSGTGGWLIDGVALAPTSDPEPCPACAASRWLRIAWWVGHWGPAVTRHEMRRNNHADTVSGTNAGPSTMHACQQPLDDHWTRLPYLTLRVGPHGDSTEHAGLTVRTISHIAATRLDGDAPDLSEPPPGELAGPVVRHRTHWSGYATTELLDALTEVGDRADELNARVEAALADTAAELGPILGRRRRR